MRIETKGRKCCMCHKPVAHPWDYCSVECRKRDEQMYRQTEQYRMGQAELQAKTR